MENRANTELPANSSEKLDAERKTLTLKAGPRKAPKPPTVVPATVQPKTATKSGAKWTEDDKRRMQAFISR